MEKYLENYQRWLNSSKLTTEEKAELESIKNDDNEIKSRFISNLSFGTAGLRGTMKLGTNAMNIYTVAQATQGFAALISKSGRNNDGVAIAYDCRNNSELFAKVAAEVLAASDIKVYIFDNLRPTPELSFALRHLKCVAGINITASHNPKEYNGYKAYWEDGAQLPPEHAEIVSREIENTDIFDGVRRIDFDSAVKQEKIKIIGEEIDKAYLCEVYKQTVNPDAVRNAADNLKIVYTPLHGAGYKLVPEILEMTGLKHLYRVEEQFKIDGNFPTVKKPNPEYEEVFTLGIKLADSVGSDLIIATDPDADRVGVMARCKDSTFKTITGNQMGALLLDYIITAYEETDTMPSEPYAIKTIVSTELVSKICEAHGIRLYNVLTGFKFIGEVIKKHEEEGRGSFLFGFEESYGYLKGTYARDKDAVVASMLICEMTAYYKLKNMTLVDALDSLYEKYGYYSESNIEIYMEGLDGPAKIAGVIDSLRNRIPTALGDAKVTVFGDYKAGEFTELETGRKYSTELPRSNVLSFKLENGDVILVRPSGTEPKIKYYFLVSGSDKADTERKISEYKKSLNV